MWSGPRPQVVQSFLEDQLIQFQFGHDLLQLSALFLKTFHLRHLRSAHSAEPPAPIVVCGITDADATTGRCNISAPRQLQLDLKMQL